MTRSMLLLSGWAHCAEVLKPLSEELSAFGSVVLTSPSELLEQEGDCAGLSSYASGLSKLLLKLPRPRVVVGWSMGAIIALELASRNREAIDKLVAISATSKFIAQEGYSCGVPAREFSSMRVRLKRNPQRTLRDFFEQVSAPNRLPKDRVEQRVEEGMSFRLSVLNHGMKYLEVIDLREEIENITCPVMTVHGRLDRIIPYEASDYFSKALCVSEGLIIDGGGHDLFSKHMQQIVPSIAGFVSGE